MHIKLMKQDVAPNKGSPTKSILVNKFIKRVKKQEVRKQGKPSQAACAIKIKEFYEFIIRCRENYSMHIEYRIGVAYFF